MPSLNHIHTYVKYKRRPGYWRCDDKYCTHVMDSEAVRGKASLCSCGKEFILDREAMRRIRPKCIECSNTKKSRAFKAAKVLVGNLMPPGIFDEDEEE